MTHPLAGRKQSAEHVAKRVAALRANGTYAKNRKRMAALGRSQIGRSLPEAHRRNISVSMKGKRNCLGRTLSLEHRQKLSDHWREHPTEHPNYIDGRSQQRAHARQLDMGRLEYRLWRQAVFARDDWTCVFCGERGGKLHADHIKPYAVYSALRYELSNGRTLCAPCHAGTPTFGGRARDFICAEEMTQ